jgi:hypothetical protein
MASAMFRTISTAFKLASKFSPWKGGSNWRWWCCARIRSERGHPRVTSRQHWSTFVRNHAKAVVACDFFVSVTASFRILYVFVAMEVGSRRILRPHPSLGPSVPEPMEAKVTAGSNRHKLPIGYNVTSPRVLDGLHHEYRLESEAA